MPQPGTACLCSLWQGDSTSRTAQSLEEKSHVWTFLVQLQPSKEYCELIAPFKELTSEMLKMALMIHFYFCNTKWKLVTIKFCRGTMASNNFLKNSTFPRQLHYPARFCAILPLYTPTLLLVHTYSGSNSTREFEKCIYNGLKIFFKFILQHSSWILSVYSLLC